MFEFLGLKMSHLLHFEKDMNFPLKVQTFNLTYFLFFFFFFLGTNSENLDNIFHKNFQKSLFWTRI